MDTTEIFCSYAPADQSWVSRLKEHLAPLFRRYPWAFWSEADISPGSERGQEIQKHLDKAQIILLLISPAFMDSEYCYSEEMTRAMERHNRGEARVIPIILRPVLWQEAPFGGLQVLPTKGKPVTDQTWHTLDDALFNVAEGIRLAIEQCALAPQTDSSSALPTSRSLQTLVPSTLTNVPVRSQPPDEPSSVASISLLPSPRRPYRSTDGPDKPKYSRRALIISVVPSLAIIGSIVFGVVSCVAQQYQLKPPTGFTVTSTVLQGGQMMQPGQVLVDADIPLTIQGTCASQGAGLVWAVLHDPYGNYYLQNPRIQFNGGGTWSVTNITPKAGIATIDFVAVTPDGNGTFQQKVSNRDFSAFTYAQFPQSSLILRATISVNTSQLSS